MSLVFINANANPGYVHLLWRTHDLSGTNYEHHLTLPREAAESMAGDHTGLHFLYAEDNTKSAPLKPVTVERFRDRAPGTRAWALRVGSDLVRRGNLIHGADDAEPSVIRLSDELVKLLEKHSQVSFEPGQPDWSLREVENLEDVAFDKEDTARKARETASLARIAYENKLHRDPQPEITDGVIWVSGPQDTVRNGAFCAGPHKDPEFIINLMDRDDILVGMDLEGNKVSVFEMCGDELIHRGRDLSFLEHDNEHSL